MRAQRFVFVERTTDSAVRVVGAGARSPRRGRRWFPVVAGIVVAGGALNAQTAFAVCSLSPASTWSLGASGNWNTAGNWTPAGVPNSAATNVCIVDGASTVTLNVSANVGSLEIAAGNQLQNANSTFLLVNGNVNNAGTLGVNAVGGLTDLIVGSGGTVSFSGGGNVTLSNSGNNRVYSNTTGSVLNNVDNVFRGAGQIFSNGRMSVVNGAGGVFDANQTQALSLSGFNSVGATFTNAGILRATNTTVGNGGLVISSMTLDNTASGNSGRVSAIGSNSHVNLASSAIVGGTLSTSGGGVIQTTSGFSALDGRQVSAPVIITAGSNVNVSNATGLDLYGSIANSGTITVNAGGSLTDLRMADGTTLTGGGSIVLSGSGNGRIYGVANSGMEVVTNVDNTISGTGHFGAGNSVLFKNQAGGLVVADQATALTITPTTINSNGQITTNGGGFVNQGTLRATGAGGLVLSGGQFNNNGGTIEALTGSTVWLQGGTTISGGTLGRASGGEVRTTANNSVNLDGVSQGTLTIAGNYVAGNNSVTNLSGAIANTGTLKVDAGVSLTDLHFADGTTLTGGGTIRLSDNGNNRVFGVANSGLEVVTNVDNTIVGAGQFGVGNSVLFKNLAGGVIRADGVTALNVTPTVLGAIVGPNGGGLVNQGLMQATGAGGLGLVAGQINNNGGTIEALAGSTVTLWSGATVSGGTLRGVSSGLVQTAVGHSANLDGASQGTLTLAGNYRASNGSVTVLSGTIANTGTFTVDAPSSLTDLKFASGTQLTGAGSLVLTTNSRVWGASNSGTEVLTNVNNTISGTGLIGIGNGFSFVNGGTVVANQSSALTMSLSTLPALTTSLLNQASGVLRGTGTGGLVISTGKVDNQGLVEALANSSVTYGVGATTLNNQAGNLVGGIWSANSLGGASATITLRGSNITTNSADIYLTGAGSNINVAGTSIDTTLSTNNGSLRLHEGRAFTASANGGNFTNNGLIELASGAATSTFKANTSLTNTGSIVGYGVVDNRVQNSGAGAVVQANLGTLTVNGGITGGGQAISNAGATLNLSNATAASNVNTLAVNGALNLGAQNVNVAKDYTNANWGSGNGFNARANVSGAGQITGVNAAQSIGGDAVLASANTYTLDLGAVRGGTSVTKNLTIVNSGSGADIRGAIQTGAPGLGNVTDARLSGAGVTAGNFGPIAAGGNSGNLAVTFNASSGGALTGQSVAVVSNFGNVATQTVNLTGTASALAVGNATPNGNPVDLGNFRVGGAQPSQQFAVQNTTSGAGAERLGIQNVSTGGQFSASNNLGAGFINGGASQANAVGVSVVGGQAGVNNGSVTIQYTTNGQLISGAFGTIGANTQNINLSASGYLTATGAVNTAALNFGTVQVGQVVQQTLSITNNRVGPAGYVEDLNARFGASGGTGGALISGAGSVTGLAAGATNASNMVVTVNTAGAGTINGTIDVNFFSSGKVAGVDKGLGGEIAANTVAYGVAGTIQTQGQVINQASPVINTTQPIDLGNVRVGQASPTALVSVTNQATTAPQAALNATITGNAPITGSGSFNLLAPGATNASALQVGMNTATAGAISGTATIAFVSDASNVGNCAPNCQLNLASQNVQVNGKVFQEAQPSVASSVNLGNVRVGQSASQALVIGNTNVAPAGYQEGLDASVKAQSNATGSGAFTNLAAGGTSSSITVGMTAASAGVNTGSVTLKLDSNGAGTSGLPTLGLADKVVSTSITGYNQAVGQTSPASPPTLDLGAVRVGQAMTQVLSVSNVAPGGAFTEKLNAGFGTNTGNATNNGAVVNLLAAGAPASTAMVAGLDTSAAGVRSGSVTINYQTDGTGTSGLGQASAGSQTIALTGKVYTPAVAVLNTQVIDFGVVRVGQVVADRNVTVTNAAVATALNDTMSASIASGGSPFTATGSTNGIGAGASNAAGTLKVGLNTSAAGAYTAGSAMVSFKSQNADMADQDLGGQSVTLKATVNYFAKPLFTLLSGYGLSGGGNSFTLDLGNLLAGSGPTHLQLGLANAAQGGPQDGLRGAFDTSAVNDFAASGWGTVPDLAVGQMLAGLFLDFNPLALGLYTDSIVFHGLSFNESDPSGAALGDVTLVLRANVVDQPQDVPEPGVLALMLAGGLAAVAGARRRRARVLH